MKRERVADRQAFSISEKQEVLVKTKGRCAHCGKPISIMRGDFTMEHVVPISKGGTNEKKNLVGLCFECNYAKGDLVVSPSDYYDYLDARYIKEADDMFAEYISNVDRLDRNNVLAVDFFKMENSEIAKVFSQKLVNKKPTAITPRMNKKAMLKTLKNKGLNNSYQSRYSDMSHRVSKALDGVTVKKADYSDLDDLYYFTLSEVGKVTDRCTDYRKEIKESIQEAYSKSCIFIVRSQGVIVGSFVFGIMKDAEGLYNIHLRDILVKYSNSVVLVVCVIAEVLNSFCMASGFWDIRVYYSCYVAFKYAYSVLIGIGDGSNATSEVRGEELMISNLYSMDSTGRIDVVSYKRKDVENPEYQSWLKKVFNLK